MTPAKAALLVLELAMIVFWTWQATQPGEELQDAIGCVVGGFLLGIELATLPRRAA